jgi:hypothetical protein
MSQTPLLDAALRKTAAAGSEYFTGLLTAAKNLQARSPAAVAKAYPGANPYQLAALRDMTKAQNPVLAPALKGLVGPTAVAAPLVYGGAKLTGSLGEGREMSEAEAARDKAGERLVKLKQKATDKADAAAAERAAKDKADADLKLKNDPFLQYFDKNVAGNDKVLADLIGADLTTESGKLEFAALKDKLTNLSVEDKAALARNYATSRDAAAAKAKADAEAKGVSANRAGIASFLEGDTAGLRADGTPTQFKDLGAAYGGGIKGFGEAVINHPAAAAQTWWRNIKGGDIETVGGTAAATAAALFGAYGLKQLLGGKKKKYAAAAADPKAISAMDFAISNGQKPYWTADGMIRVGNKTFTAEQLGETRPPAVNGVYPAGEPVGTADVELEPGVPAGTPVVPPERKEAPKVPSGGGDSLAAQFGHKIRENVLPTSLQDIGVSNSALGYGAAGVGAVAVLGGVLLANKLRKSKKVA